jgi:LemA protein
MGNEIGEMEAGRIVQRRRRPLRSAAIRLLAMSGLVLLTSGCGYNTMVSQHEAVDAAWSEVENQLQRRNDLIPNLVSTVKGFAAQEQEVLTAVTRARSRIEVANERGEQIAAANALSASLSRLVGVVERYPDLKSNQNFIRLQDSLEGTENRLAVARKRYNDAVRTYNTTIRRFPTNLMAGVFSFEPETYFDAPESAGGVPAVEF